MNVSNIASPLVSVIMPAFNSERHIAESVASVQAQTMSWWELLIEREWGCGRCPQHCSRKRSRTIYRLSRCRRFVAARED